MLARTLEREGIYNFSQDYFSAERNQTVTKWVSGHGVPCIQLEISATWVAPEQDNLSAHRYAQLLEGLVRFIQAVDSGQVR